MSSDQFNINIDQTEADSQKSPNQNKDSFKSGIYSVENLLSDIPNTCKSSCFTGKENISEHKEFSILHENYINNCMASALYQQALQCYRPFFNRPFLVNPFYHQPYVFNPLQLSQHRNNLPIVKQSKYSAIRSNFQKKSKRRSSLYCDNIDDSARIFTCASCEYDSSWKCDMLKHCKNYGHEFGYCPTPQKNGYSSDQLNAKLKLEIERTVNEQKAKAIAQQAPFYQCEHCFFGSDKPHYLTMHIKAHQK